jgi:hypothetical protein
MDYDSMDIMLQWMWCRGADPICSLSQWDRSRLSRLQAGIDTKLLLHADMRLERWYLGKLQCRMWLGIAAPGCVMSQWQSQRLPRNHAFTKHVMLCYGRLHLDSRFLGQLQQFVWCRHQK